MNSTAKKYLVLVRHGERAVRYDIDEEHHDLTLTSTARDKTDDRAGSIEVDGRSDFKVGGYTTVRSMAGRLADALKAEGVTNVERIVCSGHSVAVSTAVLFREVLTRRFIRGGQPIPIQIDHRLTPQTFGHHRNSPPHEDYQPLSDGAVVVVGHQPKLTWIARLALKRLLGNALPSGILPIGNAEAACIRIQPRPKRLLWLITNKDKDLLVDLQAKIKAKYEVAKFLLGAFVVQAGLVLNADVLKENGSVLDQSVAVAGIVLLVGALGLTVGTLFGYDALQMPSTFWGAGKPKDAGRDPRSWTVNRPPSQKHLKLYYDMVHVWQCFFLPALLVAGAAHICFLFVLVRTNLNWSAPTTLLWVGGGAAAAVGSSILLYLFKKPSLGVED